MTDNPKDFLMPAGSPKYRRPHGDLQSPNHIRTWRESPTSTAIQIRTAKGFVSASLSLEDARIFANAIIHNSR